METRPPYNRGTPDTKVRGDHLIVVCYIDGREQKDLGKEALERIGWCHLSLSTGGFWKCPFCKHKGVQTTADASDVQPSADTGPDMSLVAGDCGRCGDDKGGAEHQERCVAKWDYPSVQDYFRALRALEGRS
jgi:hypothetical protein